MYNIAIVSNEGYIQHAGVMLSSLFETNITKRFNIYLFTDGISKESQDNLYSFCQKYGSKLIVRHPEKELANKISVDLHTLPVGQWNTIMYFKLFMPLILPEDVERCLFLDVDMIINDDIEPLYNWSLEDSVIAAAEDMPDCMEFKKRLGLQQSDKYINSGVMVCDISKWRQLEKERPIFDFANQVRDIITNEQDVIALYFKNRISLLPIRWNMTTFYFMRVPKIFDKYLIELPESKKNPGIIHYACPIKPWFKDCQHPYKGLYKNFLRKTPWKGYKFSYFEKLSNIKRLKRAIRYQLNCCNILKDEMVTLPVK